MDAIAIFLVLVVNAQTFVGEPLKRPSPKLEVRYEAARTAVYRICFSHWKQAERDRIYGDLQRFEEILTGVGGEIVSPSRLVHCQNEEQRAAQMARARRALEALRRAIKAEGIDTSQTYPVEANDGAQNE